MAMTPASPASTVPGSKVKGLNCPGCGAALTVRGFEHTVSVVCPQCLAILDAKDPNLQILQKFTDQTRITLLIPLGSRGNWKGTVYEVIGFQRRTFTVEGTEYAWSEYLLFNPFRGFRYFTEYSGHWNDVRTLRALPRPVRGISVKPQVQHAGVSYSHFSTAQARTSYVLGEFPWQVKRGEAFAVKDYIAPPMILSSESNVSETTWSVGEYTDGREIWKAFKLPGSAPRPSGVFLNQPSPYAERARGMWQWFGTFLLIAIVILLANYALAGNEEVFSDSYRFTAGTQAEASFVTPIFEFKGRSTNVQVETRADVNNSWVYFNYALINEETGQAYDFGRELTYYFGSDSDGSWTEGNKSDSVTLPSIPGGRYYLRVEPEVAPGLQTMSYSIRLRRDVPGSVYFWIVLALLLIPPVLATFRKAGFETHRWQESDYAPVSAPSDDGDDD
jgi:hypothetical protein